MPEIRENRLTGEWVIIAPERARRGGNLAVAPTASSVPEHSATCPFCPGQEVMSEQTCREDDAQGRWLLRAVLNKYSVLSLTGEVERSNPPGEESTLNAVGMHEVIIESPLHNGFLATGPLEQTRRVLEAYLHRFTAFYQDPRVRHVIIFKNHGSDAGASQQHPHSQIVGLPIVPGQIMERIARTRRFYRETGECLGCSLLAREREQGLRIVAENERFVAFIPYAALSPYHLWIFPKAHAACFSTQAPGAMADLAAILHTVLSRIHRMLGNPAYNLIMRSLSPVEAEEPHFHWYFSIVPRVVKVAGFELGTGMYINPSLPEDRAAALREFGD